MASKLTKDGLILPDTGDYKQEKTVISVEGVEADNQGKIVLSSDQDKTLDERINLLEAGSGSGDAISGITHIDESEYGPTQFLGKFDMGQLQWYGPHITFTYANDYDNIISQWSRGDILDVLDTPGGNGFDTSASDDSYGATTAAFHIVSIDTTNRKIVLNRGSHTSLDGWTGDSWIQVQNEKFFGEYVYFYNLEIPQNNGNGLVPNLSGRLMKVRNDSNYAGTNSWGNALQYPASLPVDWTHIPSTATHLLIRTISKTKELIKIYNRDISHRGYSEQFEDYELVYHNQGSSAAGGGTQVTNLFLDTNSIDQMQTQGNNWIYGPLNNETYPSPNTGVYLNFNVTGFENFFDNHSDKYKLSIYSGDMYAEVIISDLISFFNTANSQTSNKRYYIHYDDSDTRDNELYFEFKNNDLILHAHSPDGSFWDTMHRIYRIDLHNTSGSTTSSSSNILVDEFWVAVDSGLTFISQSLDGSIIMYPIAYCSVGGAQYSSLDSRITNLENNSGSGNGTVTSINNVQPDSNGNVTIDVTGPDNVLTNLFLDRSLLEAPTGVSSGIFVYGPSTQSTVNKHSEDTSRPYTFHTVPAFGNFKTNSEYTSAYMLKIHSVSGNFEVLIDDLMNYNNGAGANSTDSIAIQYDNSGQDIYMDVFFDGNDLILRTSHNSQYVEDSSLPHIFEPYRIDLYKYADGPVDTYTKSEVDSLVSSSGGGAGSGTGSGRNVVTFLSSATFEKPEGVEFLEIVLVGGGRGGYYTGTAGGYNHSLNLGGNSIITFSSGDSVTALGGGQVGNTSGSKHGFGGVAIDMSGIATEYQSGYLGHGMEFNYRISSIKDFSTGLRTIYGDRNSSEYNAEVDSNGIYQDVARAPAGLAIHKPSEYTFTERWNNSLEPIIEVPFYQAGPYNGTRDADIRGTGGGASGTTSARGGDGGGGDVATLGGDGAPPDNSSGGGNGNLGGGGQGYFQAHDPDPGGSGAGAAGGHKHITGSSPSDLVAGETKIFTKRVPAAAANYTIVIGAGGNGYYLGGGGGQGICIIRF